MMIWIPWEVVLQQVGAIEAIKQIVLANLQATRTAARPRKSEEIIAQEFELIASRH